MGRPVTPEGSGPLVIGVKIEGLEKLERKLKSPVAGPPAKRFLTRIGSSVQTVAKNEAPNAFGTLARSITFEVDTRTPVPNFVRIGTNVEYGPFVEFGRGPGKTPPVAPIEFWFRRKNRLGLNRKTIGRGNNKQSIRGIAIRISKSIGKNGTKAQPYLEPGLRNSIPTIQSLVPVLRAELEEAYKNAK